MIGWPSLQEAGDDAGFAGHLEAFCEFLRRHTATSRERARESVRESERESVCVNVETCLCVCVGGGGRTGWGFKTWAAEESIFGVFVCALVTQAHVVHWC